MRQDAGKFVTGALRRSVRDLATPIFLRLFANPKAAQWIYSYDVAWDDPVVAPLSSPAAGARAAATSAAVTPHRGRTEAPPTEG